MLRRTIPIGWYVDSIFTPDFCDAFPGDPDKFHSEECPTGLGKGEEGK